MARVLRTVARVSVALVLLDATEVKDLQRARRKIPGAAYKGHDQAGRHHAMDDQGDMARGLRMGQM